LINSGRCSRQAIWKTREPSARSHLWLCSVVCLVLCLAPASTHAQDPPEGKIVTQVEIKSDGPLSRISLDDVSKLIELRHGEPYSQAQAKNTIQRLYSTALFHDIHLEWQPEAGNTIHVTVILIRRYFIKEVTFDGDLGVDEQILRRELGFRAGEPYSAERMEETTAQLVQTYQRYGYYRVKIQPEFEIREEAGFLHVTFKVESGERAKVSGLDFDTEGNLDISQIQRLIKTRPGGFYSEEQMDQDILAIERHLAYQGFLDPDIYVRGGAVYEPTANTVSVTLRIVPRTQTRLVFEGLDPQSKEVRNLPLFTEPGAGEAFLEDSAQILEDSFHSDGYFLAEVTHELTGPEDQRVLTIRGEKGRKWELEAPRFEGNATIPSERLVQILGIRPTGVFRRGRLTDEMVQRDRERIQSFYEQRGFMEVRVDSETRPDFPSRGELTVVFKIQEGPQFFVDSVEITGNQRVGRDVLLRQVGSRAGQPFSPYQVAQDRSNLVATYEGLGYRDTDLRHDISYPRAKNHVAIRYTIKEGPQSFVEQVIVSGLLDTRKSSILREVQIAPGDPLSFDRILQTESNLQDLAVFNRVDVREAPSFSDPNRKSVIINLEEARRFNLLYGLGYSSYGGFRGTFGVSDSNFLGRVRTLSLALRGGRQRQRGTLSYTLGRVLGWKLPTVVSLLADNEKSVREEIEQGRRVIEGRPFDAFRIQAAAQAERALSARESIFFRLNFQNVRITVPPELASSVKFFREEERLRLSSMSASYLNDSRDDAVNPRTGFLLSGEALLSTKLLGSERQFFRILTQGQYYREVSQGVVLVGSLRLGTVFPFAADPQLENAVPISERFFAGGATTLRGLPQDLAGPLLRDPETGEIILVDENGVPDPDGRPVPLGGNALFICNLELRFPLFWLLSGALFYDTGNVFRSITDFSQAGFSNAIGFGLRANTPVGPVRFDVGYNPSPPAQVGFREWNFHLTLGHPF